MLPRVGFMLLLLLLTDCRNKSSPGWSAVEGGIQCTHLEHLACTGLYGERGEGWATRQLAPSVRAYEPGLQLWSDGLDKSRFLFLPPGTRVDTERMDEWRFPVGTRLWKEFRWKGRRIETRFLWKRAEGDWVRTAYRWNDAQTQALELPDGERDVPGTEGHDIPSQGECEACHQGREDGVLGFEAVALAHERARGLTLETLSREGLLTHPPPAAPRIPGNPVEQAALGWLHMNCGVSCHNAVNAGAMARATGLHLRLEVSTLASVKDTAAFQTSVGTRSLFQPLELSASSLPRISPGDAARSTLFYRIGRRDPAAQMPPLGTHRVDEQGVALVRQWIQQMH